MSEIEAFLDETPGETRGVLVRDGLFHRLIVHRDDDIPGHRLGARSIGRIEALRPDLHAAFVDLDGGDLAGFLPLVKGATLHQGEAVEVEVTAEPRQAKGPTLRLIGPGQGPARLLAEGPSVRSILARRAPDSPPILGAAAIQAAWDAEEEALSSRAVFAAYGLDLAVERTRALVAVDIDHAAPPGRDARGARARANAEGLVQAARLIGLKSWGGLVVVDLVGTALDPKVVTTAAAAAFGGTAAIGPLSRFGLLQLSLAWGARPIEEILLDRHGRRTLRTRAADVVRRLRHGLLADTAAPRLLVRCTPVEAELAATWVARRGPRAVVQPDPSVGAGCSIVEEG